MKKKRRRVPEKRKYKKSNVVQRAVLSFLKSLGGALLLLVFVGAFCYFSGILKWVFPSMETKEVWNPQSQIGESVGTKAGEAVRKVEKVPVETVEEEEPEEDKEEENESIRLLFAGDLFLTESLQGKYKSQGILAAATEELLEVTKSADIFMVNNEFPYGTTGEAMEDKEYTFRILPEFVSLTKELGVDIVTLANNHVLDFGREPLTETLAALDGAEIAHVGAGENLEEARALKTLEAQGKTIGFLGASRVIPENSWNASRYNAGVFTTYDATQLVEDIQKAKEACDYVVVYVHWGIERNTEPEDYQKTLARQYIDAGADAVIGSHPHVLQGIEYYQGKPIFYSLGNYIFANRDYETVMAELILTGGEVQVSVIPCASKSNQMGLLSEKTAFYENLESLSFNVEIGEDGLVREK